jgi:sulfur relay (sulfurtransferase) complex TusBCD TusD component (DsrE family)
MNLAGKKLGILVSAAPGEPNFQHAAALAKAALADGVQVYFYCLDEAVPGIEQESLQQLRRRGMNLFACAFGARRRNLPVSEKALFSGLSVLHDLIGETDRFVTFT